MCLRLRTSHVVSNWQLRLWWWQLWGVWNWKPCQSIPHLAWGATSGSGFPFKKGPFSWMCSLNQQWRDSCACFKANPGPKYFKHLANSYKISGLKLTGVHLHEPKLNMTYDIILHHLTQSLEKCPGTREQGFIWVDFNCTGKMVLPVIALIYCVTLDKLVKGFLDLPRVNEAFSMYSVKQGLISSQLITTGLAQKRRLLAIMEINVTGCSQLKLLSTFLFLLFCSILSVALQIIQQYARCKLCNKL